MFIKRWRGKNVKKEEKLKKKLNDEEYIKNITTEYEKDRKIIMIDFERKGQPVNYVRERYTGRGHRFYNAKAGIMKEINKFFLANVPEHHKETLKKLVNNPDAVYNVLVYVDFYVKTPNGDSVETTVLKENRVIKPAIAPDTDNYIKLLLDTLHGVAYDDDKRVVTISANKYFSMDPRTEVRIFIEIDKE
jgi:Holliday junction resolvase RusA-like endonuclease